MNAVATDRLFALEMVLAHTGISSTILKIPITKVQKNTKKEINQHTCVRDGVSAHRNAILEHLDKETVAGNK